MPAIYLACLMGKTSRNVLYRNVSRYHCVSNLARHAAFGEAAVHCVPQLNINQCQVEKPNTLTCHSAFSKAIAVSQGAVRGGTLPAAAAPERFLNRLSGA